MKIESLRVDLTRQVMCAMCSDGSRVDYVVSTALNGPGEEENSECTPRGLHEICAKIGEGCAPNTVFVGRVPTGELWSEALARQHPGRDWILSRILWLHGLEPGRNQGGTVDTRSRYIYIHGTPGTTALGVPGSRGCIRMRNADITQLFDAVTIGTPVLIDV